MDIFFIFLKDPLKWNPIRRLFFTLVSKIFLTIFKCTMLLLSASKTINVSKENVADLPTLASRARDDKANGRNLRVWKNLTKSAKKGQNGLFWPFLHFFKNSLFSQNLPKIGNFTKIWPIFVMSSRGRKGHIWHF